MNLNTLHLGVQLVAAFIGILSFSLLFVIAYSYHPQQMVIKTYQRIHNQLKEKKSSWFDYQKIQSFLDKNGAAYHIGGKINPIRYYVMNLTIATFCILAGSRFHFMVSILLSIVGFQLPKIYLLCTNKQDNEKLLPEIKLIFNALAIQIRSGVHVSNALAEAYGSVTNKRLRSALIELAGDIILRSDIKEALEQFQKKFDNRYIDSLCIILLQAMESGQAVELLGDISDQIKDMESVVLQKKKAGLDRKVTFYLLGIMAAILTIVIYACVTQMFSSAVNF